MVSSTLIPQEFKMVVSTEDSSSETELTTKGKSKQSTGWQKSLMVQSKWGTPGKMVFSPTQNCFPCTFFGQSKIL